MTIEKDKIVSIHYTLKGDDGQTIDSSVGSAPLEYLHGRNYLLEKLEDALNGKNPGDKFHIDLPPKDGYGEYNETLVNEVPRSDFETDEEIVPGMAFQAMTAQGPAIVVVKKVTPDTITVDANHELAGQNLHFDVEIVDVRDATENELQSGRVGGGCGGCCGGCGSEDGEDCCSGGCGDGCDCGCS